MHYWIKSWLLIGLLAWGNVALANASDDQKLSEEQKKYIAWAKQLWDSLDRQTGKIELPNGIAVLNVPENFYYLSPKDAEKVLVDAWGNPPGETTLGMLMPAQYTPFDSGSWAVTIEYLDDGHVNDDDAEDIDYGELLGQMQADTRSENPQRIKQGYAPIELVGWAQQPFYDAKNKKLHWAQELKFGDNQENTLNYNIRVLGREGVLLMNFIAGMSQLEEINSQVDSVLGMADFKDGQRYSDFDPSVDQVAAYGIGTLIAGKVLAKTGLLAAGLLLLKKFWFLILIGLGAIAKFFRPKKQEEPAGN